jgi:hypothetical protein
MTRTVITLAWAACGLLAAGFAVAATGAALGNALYLFDVGMWMLIAAFPAAAAWILLAIVEATPWHHRWVHARWQAALDAQMRRARLGATYRLRRL